MYVECGEVPAVPIAAEFQVRIIDSKPPASGRHDSAKARDTMADKQRTERGTERESGLAVQEARPKLKKPPLYKVVMLNDDYTPMEFVVHVLETFFSLDRNAATRIMLEVHTRGKGICGVFTHEIAETKAAQVNTYARENQHPLLCTLELA